MRTRCRRMKDVPEGMAERRCATEDSVLTTRERETLGLVARGLTNQQIAEHLSVHVHTVKACLYQACLKLGAANRSQAVILALTRGFLDPEYVYSLEELADMLLPPGSEAGDLTQREQEILFLVSWGLTNQDIARHLYLEVSTVKTCLHDVCVKLGVPNRVQAATLAVRRGLLHSLDLFSPESVADMLVASGAEAIETITEIVRRRLHNLGYDEISAAYAFPKIAAFLRRLAVVRGEL